MMHQGRRQSPHLCFTISRHRSIYDQIPRPAAVVLWLSSRIFFYKKRRGRLAGWLASGDDFVNALLSSLLLPPPNQPLYSGSCLLSPSDSNPVNLLHQLEWNWWWTPCRYYNWGGWIEKEVGNRFRFTIRTLFLLFSWWLKGIRRRRYQSATTQMRKNRIGVLGNPLVDDKLRDYFLIYLFAAFFYFSAQNNPPSFTHELGTKFICCSRVDLSRTEFYLPFLQSWNRKGLIRCRKGNKRSLRVFTSAERRQSNHHFFCGWLQKAFLSTGSYSTSSNSLQTD